MTNAWVILSNFRTYSEDPWQPGNIIKKLTIELKEVDCTLTVIQYGLWQTFKDSLRSGRKKRHIVILLKWPKNFETGTTIKNKILTGAPVTDAVTTTNVCNKMIATAIKPQFQTPFVLSTTWSFCGLFYIEHLILLLFIAKMI